MSEKSKGQACTFSAISGHILRDGQPVVHAKVIRTTEWSKKLSDEAVTDANGYFEMPARFESDRLSFLPREFVVTQTLTVVDEATEDQIWWGVKRSKEVNSESQGKPLVVSCDLSRAVEILFVDRQTFKTKCTWDVEPDPPFTDDFFETE